MNPEVRPFLSAGEYPPAPWHLCGQAIVSLWLVPRSAVESFLPSRFSSLNWGRRVLVTTAWVIYEEGGVLSYREFLFGVLGRIDRRWGVTIPWICVDSAASLKGGRELWEIPKEWADFEVKAGKDFEAAARVEGKTVASCRFRPGLDIPGCYRGYSRVVQPRGAAAKVAAFEGRVSLSLGRAEWTIPSEGALGFLSGGRPFLTVRLRRFDLDFGV